LSFREIIKKVNKVLDNVFRYEAEKIDLATALIAHAWENEKFVHVFGAGRAQIYAQEVTMRAGVPVLVNGILDVGTSLYAGILKSFLTKRTIGYGGVIARCSEISEGDVVIILSESGAEEVAIDLALNSQDYGARVVAIISMETARNVSSEHPSGRRLDEVADIVINNHLSFCGIVSDDLFVGNLSLIVNTTILYGLFRGAAKMLYEKGKKLEVWRCDETYDGLNYNMELAEEKFGKK